MPYISSIERRSHKEGLKEGILAILEGRFGEVPSTVVESLASLEADRLKQLSLLAATSDSLETFQQALE